MRPSVKTKHPLRCTCNLKPMLAMWGKDENDNAYVHVRVYKQDRMYAEIYTIEPIMLCCRACETWWYINIRNNKDKMKPVDKPGAIGP